MNKNYLTAFASTFICLFLVMLMPATAQGASSLNTYSLSFATIHNWWPNANNTVQQVDAALWKDNDGDNVKQFSNLRAEWKFDANYYQITDTTSFYQQTCPIERVGNRPCMVFSVHVIPLKSGKTDVQLTLSDNQGGSVWNAEPAVIDDLSSQITPTLNPSGLSQYSLSFESDPVRKFWPTPPNHFQGVAAALWKDSDGDNVKRFTNLQAEWIFDPKYFSVSNTSSQYFNQCPIQMVNNRPCIYFYANVATKSPGRTTVQLRVKNNLGEEAWNSYPVIIDDISQSPAPVISAGVNTQTPLPSIASGREYNDLEQKVTMLEKKVQEQDVQIKQTQGLLERILSFLQTFFHF